MSPDIDERIRDFIEGHRMSLKVTVVCYLPYRPLFIYRLAALDTTVASRSRV